MATSADTSRSAPDPSTFVQSYPQNVDKVYIVFSLRPKLAGKVTGDLTHDGTSLLATPVSLEYLSTNSWGDFEIALDGKQPAGTYIATVTYAPTGESQSISFTLDPLASASP